MRSRLFRAKEIFDTLKKQGVRDLEEYFENNHDKLYECYDSPKFSLINQKLLDIREAKDLNELQSWGNLYRANAEYWKIHKRTMIDLAKGRTRLSRTSKYCQ
jgi:hypothetical protein